MNASTWLQRNKPVEQMTWAPGLPVLIKDRVAGGGGWKDRPGSDCFNLYRPPIVSPGDHTKAGPWIEHIKKIYPDDAAHIIYWLAHRVQRPGDKINHALLLWGNQGIGKDTLLAPAKLAVGPWNWQEISPTAVLSDFNGFAKSVVTRINEIRDLGEHSRNQFYEHMKIYTAAPPDVIRVNQKFTAEYPVLNCVGIIITTNHKAGGMYLPVDERRHYVAWSEAKRDQFGEEYWKKMWDWYEGENGLGHVGAYLANLDLSGFNAKAPPPKTEAFWAFVSAYRAPESAELADTLEELGNPSAMTLDQVQVRAFGSDFALWLGDRKNRRYIPHRFEECGYIPVRNPDAEDGLWRISQKRQVVYAKKDLPLPNQIDAARRLSP
jgi:hypothetical protein